MTTGSSISVVVGLYEMYDSPTTSRLGAKVTASQTARAFKVEVSTEKSKVLNNSTSDINTGISKNSQKLKDVTSFLCTWEQSSQRMAPAQQKPEWGSPQQWQ